MTSKRFKTFDALLTVDQDLEYQQNLSGLTISVVVMVAASNDVDDLRPLLPGVEQALADVRAGEISRVANLQMEPTRQTVHAIMSSARGAKNDHPASQ